MVEWRWNQGRTWLGRSVAHPKILKNDLYLLFSHLGKKLSHMGSAKIKIRGCAHPIDFFVSPPLDGT
jgi:hypothetical protein